MTKNTTITTLSGTSSSPSMMKPQNTNESTQTLQLPNVPALRVPPIPISTAPVTQPTQPTQTLPPIPHLPPPNVRRGSTNETNTESVCNASRSFTLHYPNYMEGREGGEGEGGEGEGELRMSTLKPYKSRIKTVKIKSRPKEIITNGNQTHKPHLILSLPKHNIITFTSNENTLTTIPTIPLLPRTVSTSPRPPTSNPIPLLSLIGLTTTADPTNGIAPQLTINRRRHEEDEEQTQLESENHDNSQHLTGDLSSHRQHKRSRSHIDNWKEKDGEKTDKQKGLRISRNFISSIRQEVSGDVESSPKQITDDVHIELSSMALKPRSPEITFSRGGGAKRVGVLDEITEKESGEKGEREDERVNEGIDGGTMSMKMSERQSGISVSTSVEALNLNKEKKKLLPDERGMIVFVFVFVFVFVCVFVCLCVFVCYVNINFLIFVQKNGNQKMIHD
jgi:hypothetical protein